MKYRVKARLLALFLALSMLAGLMTACETAHEPLSLGVPYAHMRAVARVVWDLMLFDGKLYAAAGDYGRDISPEKILRYDPIAACWEEAGVLDDEQILRFLVLDGSLYIPGTDPRSSWELGTLYRLEGDRFKEYLTIERGVHNFDMEAYDGKLFAAIGTDTNTYPVVVSKDGGESFQTVPLYREGVPETPANAAGGEVNRIYNLFRLSAGLFLLYRDSLYRYDSETGVFQWQKEYRNYYLDESTYVPILSDCEFSEYFFFTTMYLYRAPLEGEGIGEPQEIELPDQEKISDLLVYGDTLYLLTFRKWGLSYTTKVYTTTDGEQFKETLSFTAGGPAMSFVYDGEGFYFGMGEINSSHEENGTVLYLPYRVK